MTSSFIGATGLYPDIYGLATEIFVNTTDDFGSNYTLNLNNNTINYVNNIDDFGSNYILNLNNDTINYVNNIDDFGSNYTLILNNDTINYVNNIDDFGSNYTLILNNDTINYVNNIDDFGSNYTLILNNFMSNYVDELSTYIDNNNTFTSNYIIDTLGLTIEEDISTGNKWLAIYNDNQNTGEDDDPNMGNIQFFHLWNEKQWDNLLGYQDTGNNIRSCHSRINANTGRLDVFWHLGDTNIIPDSIDDFLTDNYNIGWYDILEEHIILYNWTKKKVADIPGVKSNSCLKITSTISGIPPTTKKELYVNLYDNHFTENNSWDDRLELKLQVNSGIDANTYGITINTDVNSIGIGTVSPLTNELYVKTNTTGGIGTSSTGIKIKTDGVITTMIKNDAVDTDKLDYSTLHFGADVNKKLIIKDSGVGAAQIATNAITNTKINNNAVDTDKLDYSTLHFGADVNKKLIIKNDGVGANQIATNAITNIKIINKAVDTDKLDYSTLHFGADVNKKLIIKNDGVGAAQIATNAITNIKIINKAVDTDKLDYSTLHFSADVNKKLIIKDNVFHPKFTVSTTTGTNSYPELSLSVDNKTLNFKKNITLQIIPIAGGSISTLTYNSLTHKITFTPKVLLNTAEIAEVNSLAGALDSTQTGVITLAYTTITDALVAVDTTQWAAISGLALACGFNTLGLVGNAIGDAITNGGNTTVDVIAPLLQYTEGIGLLYNKNELKIADTGALELHDAYGRLIDWSLDSDAYGNNVYLVGVSGTGIVDLIQNLTINDASLWDNNIIEPRLNGETGIIDMPYSLNAYEDHFGYNSTSLFTDHTKLTISFWTKTNGTNSDQHNQGPEWNEEAIFNTNNSYTGAGSSSDNGINLKFNFEWSDKVRFKNYVKFNTSGGTVEKEIWNNWDGLGSSELEYLYTLSQNWHNYTYVLTLTDFKLYIDGVLLGVHTYDFGVDTPTNMYNLDYHLFRGYNQHGPLPLYKQYWNGVVGDIRIFNAALTQSQITELQMSTGYIGDKKVFADRLKLSSDFNFNINKELILTNDYIQDLTNTSNELADYIEITSNILSTYTDNSIISLSSNVDDNFLQASIINSVIPFSNINSFEYDLTTFIYANDGETCYDHKMLLNNIEVNLVSSLGNGYKIGNYNNDSYVGETNGYFNGAQSMWYNNAKGKFLATNSSQRTGEWFYYKLPYPVSIYGSGILRSTGKHAPDRYDLYSSDDGVNWTMIYDMTTSMSYINNYHLINLEPTTAHRYFGICIKKALYEGGSGTYKLQLERWDLYFSYDVKNELENILQGNIDIGLNISTKTTSDLIEGSNLYYTDSRFDTRFDTKSSSDLTEGTNLYYTDNRFDTRIGTKSTTDLSEGTNLYYTTARFNTDFLTKTTTDLIEGTNLYYTDTRFDTRLGTKSTTDLSEGTNLYYTTARFNTDFLTKTTTDLIEGTNLYYTDTRFDTRLGTKSTDNLTEGTSNLYYTDSRFDTRLGIKSTDNLTEGTNLYYTDTRFDTRLGTKSTDNLTEGTNLYYTDTRFDTRLGTKSTDNLTEGTNLYYTDARWDARLGTKNTIDVGSCRIGMLNGTSTTYAEFRHKDLGITTSDYGIIHHDTGILILNSSVGKEIKIREGNVDKMVIKAGNLGINTLTPSEKLDVNGDIIANYYKGDGSLLTGITADFTGKTTSDLSEGINLYYTDTRFDTRLGTKTTDNLTEGTTNKYSQFTTSGSEIYYNGNVGIGTTNPDNNLHIFTSGNNSCWLKLEENNSSTTAYDGPVIELLRNTTGGTLTNKNFIWHDYDTTDTQFNMVFSGDNYIEMRPNNTVLAFKLTDTALKLGNIDFEINDDFKIDISLKKLIVDGNNILDWATTNNLKLGVGLTSIDLECNTIIDGTLTVNGSLYDSANEIRMDMASIYNFYTHTSTATNVIFRVYRKDGANEYNCFQVDGEGDVWINGVLTEGSDKRIKENIEYIKPQDALKDVMKLKPCKYNKIDRIDKTEFGLIAQEVQEVIPEIIKVHDSHIVTINTEHVELKDYLSLSYNRLIPHLIASIQELQNKIEILELKVDNKNKK